MESPRELGQLRIERRSLREGQHTGAPRILWLHPSSHSHQRAETLIERLREAGFAVYTSASHDLSAMQLDLYDLILLSVDYILYERITARLGAIRQLTRAPVVLLTEQHSLDWFISAVRAGADAVVDARIPDDVVVAHCRALLRRWRPSP